MADIYVATTGNDSTGDGSMGNPYASPGKAGAVMVGGDRVLIKSGTYLLTTSLTNTPGGVLLLPNGSYTAPSQVIGYDVTVDDLDQVNDFSNFPILRATVGIVTCIQQRAYGWVKNLILDGNGLSSLSGYISDVYAWINNCKLINSTYGIEGFGDHCQIMRCWASGNSAAGYNIDSSGAYLSECVSTGNVGAGVIAGSVAGNLDRCLIYDNLGSSTVGVSINLQTGIRNCTVWNNGSHGIHLSAASGVTRFRNNVIGSNGGYNIYSDSSITVADAAFNFYYPSTGGGLYQWPGEPTDIALTANPFNGSSTGDFSLNLISGGGASVRGMATPGPMPGALSIGYLDGGAIQHDSSPTNVTGDLFSPADILRWVLVSLEAVGDPTILDSNNQPLQPWPGYVSVEPSLPDNCITLYDTQGSPDGRGMTNGMVYYHYGFQMRVRGVNQNTSYAKARSLKKVLAEQIYLNPITLGTATYTVHCVAGIGEVIPMGQDAPNSRRFIHTLNAFIALDYTGTEATS